MDERMRPRTLCDVSRRLATRIEEGIRGGEGEGPIPVFLCHPVEALEGRELPERGGPAGALYLYRVAPEKGIKERPVAFEAETVVAAGEAEPGGARARYAPSWVRLRYAFVLVGGTFEDELTVIAALIAALHDRPFLELVPETPRETAPAGSDPGEVSSLAVPVRIVDAPEAWREIGLEEHRLTVNLEVSLPLSSGRVEHLPAVVERDLRLQTASAGRRGDG